MLYFFRRSALLIVLLAMMRVTAFAQSAVQSPTSDKALPAAIENALARARLPRDAVSLLVMDVGPVAAPKPRLAWRTQAPMNPASVMKLATTYAALELLGPAYTWSTPVYLDGTLHNGSFNGTLDGSVYIQGQGDPKLVLERLWLMLRRLQGMGIQRIRDDIVLDRSAFASVVDTDPAEFDGEPLRPYNASPDALLLNFKSVLLTFTPDREAGVARVQYDPPLAGVQMQPQVALTEGPCGDYRARLKADFADPARIRLQGAYPQECGEKVWPVAYADPQTYAPRAIQGLWQQMGGTLGGSARYGTVPPRLLAVPAAYSVSSPTLGELIRDINKYSNNVMAQQVFLSLGRSIAPLSDPSGNTLSPATFTASRAVLQDWWKARIDAASVPTFDNGSGLSRHARITAQGLGALLHRAYHGPYMAELMASLPLSGVDGTLKRSKSPGAHLKTGTLNGVIARAGYVDAVSGTRYILVVLVNHPLANSDAARQCMDALIDWTTQDE